MGVGGQRHNLEVLPPAKGLPALRTGCWVWPQGRCGRLLNISPEQGFDHRIVQA
jgi:hypothetical protein